MTELQERLPRRRHAADLCVVGGGLAGLCAAIAAARRGASVVLMHDRPVLGGNASSEIRMWVCGAHGRNMLETGIVEELRLANRCRNPTGNWPIWDSILYEKVRAEPRIALLLNCSCNGLDMDGPRIRSVTGWQTTTQTWHHVEAPLFADCSGDSILAPLSGAEFRWGREGRDEFGEDIAPAAADRRTMGMSCLLQARETSEPQPFIPPDWANTYATDGELPFRTHDIHQWHTNFWWIELGGEQDSIHDTETLRDELLKIAFGVWDHIKNRGDHGAENWALDWIGFLPGKRESRRYVGDHILTQNDVRAGGAFADVVAYGGWSMDDHHPAGFRHPGAPTIYHPAPSPYGIPYRCLYSRSIENLFCAGRNISVTHTAMSSTRVMATCATLGQAVGTAAAIAAGGGLTPRQVYERRLGELQQMLMDDDCHLPGQRRTIPALSRRAAIEAAAGDPEPLRNGVDRPVGDAENAWTGVAGDRLVYTLAHPEHVAGARLVFDSDLNRQEPGMPCSYPLRRRPHGIPDALVKGFRIEVRTGRGWELAREEKRNAQRLVHVPIGREASAVRCEIVSTWGGGPARVFAFDIHGAAPNG